MPRNLKHGPFYRGQLKPAISEAARPAREQHLISRRTVLVLGAVASQPYGFPLGRRLRERICAWNRTLSHAEQALFEHHDIGAQGRPARFAATFKNTAIASIDAFLAVRGELTQIGKLTFNYNCSLEYFLFLAIQNSYALSDQAAGDVALRRRAGHQTMDEPSAVGADVDLHLEIPLLALADLLHLRVPTLRGILGRRRRGNDRRVHDRSRLEQQLPLFQQLAHFLKEPFGQRAQDVRA
jgi:hypothetical protein